MSTSRPKRTCKKRVQPDMIAEPTPESMEEVVEDPEEEEDEEVEEKPAKKKTTPKKKKAKKAEAEDDDGGGEDAAAAAPAEKPPGPGDKPRPEDDDDFWKDGDEVNVEDPREMDFAVPAKENPGQIKVVSWNVAGFKAILGKGFKDYVESEKPDILCLQETKIAESAAPKDVLPGYEQIFYECHKPGQHGTAIFSKIKPISVTKGMGIAELDTEGRLITAEFEAFYVMCCYVPNSSQNLSHWPLRKKWDAAFLEFIKTHDAKKPVIYCGDLNVARLWIDLKNPKTNKNKTAGFLYGERDNFNVLLESGFVDVFRQFFPKRKGFFTFWTYKAGPREKNIGWRLDYFIVSRRFMPSIKTIWRRPKVMGSDHCPLCIMVDPAAK